MTKFYLQSSVQTTVRILFIFLLSLSVKAVHAQNWDWVATAGGDGSDKALDIDIDRYGNEYICGYYNSGTSANDVSFGAINPTMSFGKEGFVARIDSSGNWAWVRSAIGGWDERALGLCVDNVNDYVYVCGTAWGSTNFGSCTGAYFPGGGDEIFLAKFDLAGTCQWLVGAGGSYDDHGYDVVTDKQGNIYMTGLIGDTYAAGGVVAHFGAIDVPIPMGDSLGFLTKISSSGTFLWVKTFQATDGERDNRIAIDSSANIYITGGFSGVKPFGPTTGTSNGGRDIFVLKFDSSGNQLWLRTAGGLLDDRGNSVAIDNEQDVYITGEMRDIVIFGNDTVNNNGSPAGRDIFVSKLTPSGSWVWAKKAGSNNGSDRGNRIVSNKQNLLFVTGQFRGNASFGAADTLINTTDSVQIYVAAIDTAGKWQWAIQAGSTIEDRGTGIAVDDDCNVFTTGHYELTAEFGADSVTSAGKKEIYVAKIPGACYYMLGVAEDTGYGNVHYYPNPTAGNMTVEFGKRQKRITLEVLNVLGELVQTEVFSETDKAAFYIDQASGIYFVRLSAAKGETYTFKVIKEN